MKALRDDAFSFARLFLRLRNNLLAKHANYFIITFSTLLSSARPALAIVLLIFAVKLSRHHSNKS
jgi:hypothetical protein